MRQRHMVSELTRNETQNLTKDDLETPKIAAGIGWNHEI